MPLMDTVTSENPSRIGGKQLEEGTVFQGRTANLPSLLLNPRETSWVKPNTDEGIQLGLVFFLVWLVWVFFLGGGGII